MLLNSARGSSNVQSIARYCRIQLKLLEQVVQISLKEPMHDARDLVLVNACFLSDGGRNSLAAVTCPDQKKYCMDQVISRTGLMCTK